MSHPAYETLRQVLPQASVVLQDNAGPMTLDGTNTWLLRAPGGHSSVIIDPGDADDTHLGVLCAAAPDVELVLLTHGHRDHSAGAGALHDATGAPVRAMDCAHCHGTRVPLTAGEQLTAGGVRLRVLPTPGHTADSVCFVIDEQAVLTGDTIIGRGTTVVAHPDGALAPYLDSLQRLRDLGGVHVLPGHGPELPSAAGIAEQYLAHRVQRLDQIRAALARLGSDASPRQVVELVYADVDEAVWWAAELSVRAQLDYLREHR